MGPSQEISEDDRRLHRLAAIRRSRARKEFKDDALRGLRPTGRILYVIVSGDLPWFHGFGERLADWLRNSPPPVALKPGQRKHLARELVVDKELVGQLAEALVRPQKDELLFLAELLGADSPRVPSCAFCPAEGNDLKLFDYLQDEYCKAPSRVCEGCYESLGRVHTPTVRAAVALLAEVSALEDGQLVDTLEAVESGLYEPTGSGRRRPLSDLSSAPIDNDGRLNGFHIEKSASNGVAQGAPKRGATNVAYVLAKIEPAYPIEKLRGVASLRGPAVNGDGPIRDELDRVTFEYYKVHGGNVAAFALFFGIERTHVYTRIERHRKRSQTQAA